MKISKLFHWLYASLMLLPFASVVSTTLYYSFNKNAVVPQVDKVVSKEVDFNQLVKNGDFNTSANWAVGGGTATFNNECDINIVVESGYYWTYITQGSTSINANDKYLCKIECYQNTSGTISVVFNTNVNYLSGINTNTNVGSYSNINFIFNNPDDINNFAFQCVKIGNNGDIVKYKNYQVFNLTQMFGAGNEPTIQEFNAWFPNDYYDYTLSEHIVIPNYQTIQVADNSINHFWLPSFGAIGYNIQSYISWLIGGVFGLNVANGIGFVIVRLFTYWLIISICWLIFDVLMYVPNLAHKWLDKAAIE